MPRYYPRPRCDGTPVQLPKRKSFVFELSLYHSGKGRPESLGHEYYSILVALSSPAFISYSHHYRPLSRIPYLIRKNLHLSLPSQVNRVIRLLNQHRRQVPPAWSRVIRPPNQRRRQVPPAWSQVNRLPNHSNQALNHPNQWPLRQNHLNRWSRVPTRVIRLLNHSNRALYRPNQWPPRQNHLNRWSRVPTPVIRLLNHFDRVNRLLNHLNRVNRLLNRYFLRRSHHCGRVPVRVTLLRMLRK